MVPGSEVEWKDGLGAARWQHHNQAYLAKLVVQVFFACIRHKSMQPGRPHHNKKEKPTQPLGLPIQFPRHS